MNLRVNKSSNIRLIILSIVLTFGWVVGGEYWVINPEARTTKNLKLGKKLAVFHKKTLSTLPASFNDLRAFSKVINAPFSAHDIYGSRISYSVLDNSHFILKSFGKDKKENIARGERDIYTLSSFHKPSLVQKFTHGYYYYPAVMNIGSHSPKLKWQARLFVNKKSGNRKLVIFNKERMFESRHDRVNEYIWANDQKIIFSATNSDNYLSGIYQWDFTVNNVKRIYEPKGNKKLWLSIAGLYDKNIYAFIKEKNKAFLNPVDFFNSEHLFKFDGKKFIPTELEFDSNIIDLKKNYAILNNPDEEVIHWNRLRLAGEMSGALEDWQDFVSEHSESALFSYGLWYLSTIYADIYPRFKKKKERETLRAFSLEFAHALANDHTAPDHLQDIGKYQFEMLVKERPLPYKLSSFKIHP